MAILESLAGPADANAKRFSLEPYVSESEQVILVIFRRNMVGKMVSFSKYFFVSYFIVSLASYTLWHVRPVHSCSVHEKEVSSGCDG